MGKERGGERGRVSRTKDKGRSREGEWNKSHLHVVRDRRPKSI